MATLHSSGRIDLHSDPREGYSSIAEHFGDDGNASLVEFVRGGSLVPNNNFNLAIPVSPISSSNPISMTNFHGATNESYAVSVTSEALDEGADQTFTCTTKNVPRDDPIYYTVTGIDSVDVVGDPPLSGNFEAGDTQWNGLTGYSTHEITVKMKNDLLSEGPLDSGGYPTPNTERATVTLQQTSGGAAIGGDEGVISWDIYDTSLSWYVKVTAPTPVSGVYTAEGYAQAEYMYTDSSTYYTTVTADAFGIDGYNAPAGFTIANMSLDTSYGSSGRIVLKDPSFPETTDTMVNNNLAAGYSNNPANGTKSWDPNEDTPSFILSRTANFGAVGYLGPQSYGLIIKERYKFDLTETNPSNKTIESFNCIIQTNHVLIVQGLGG